MATKLWAVGLVILASIIGSLGPILLKIGTERGLGSIKKIITNYFIWSGLALYGIGTALFIPALKGGELSVLYPIVALTYVWVSLLSKKILKEEMNKFKWLGVFIIILGVVFIGYGA
tara:strand:+ start:276 stop:626 length:351 start_codon:yes stop_codon:yes gene_type:complete